MNLKQIFASIKRRVKRDLTLRAIVASKLDVNERLIYAGIFISLATYKKKIRFCRVFVRIWSLKFGKPKFTFDMNFKP